MKCNSEGTGLSLVMLEAMLHTCTVCYGIQGCCGLRGVFKEFVDILELGNVMELCCAG
jgi:hypothetical protein